MDYLTDLEYSINPQCQAPKKAKKTCTFDELKVHVQKLNELLKDPHMGLSTWCEIYSGHMRAISDYWTYN
jgi:hypothetical protein